MKKPFIRFKIFCCLFLLSMFVALLNSCNRIEPEPNTIREYRLTEEQEKWIPYSGDDTLIFKDSMGDTLKFMGNGCKIDTMNLLNSTCRCIIYSKYCKFYQKDSLSLFTGMNPIFNDTFTIGWVKDREGLKYDSSISYFKMASYLKKNTKELKDDTLYFDSYKIENKTYFNVYKIKSEFAKSYKGRTMKTLYYNLQDGILKIEFDDNSNWTLIPR